MVRKCVIISSLIFLCMITKLAPCQQLPDESKLTETFWCHYYDSWQDGMPAELAEELGYRQYCRPGRLVHFCPDGKFEMIGGYLFKRDDKDVVWLSSGDGINVYNGKWKINKKGELSIKYRLVYATIYPVGEANKKQPWIKETIDLNSQSIVIAKDVFTPIENLSESTRNHFCYIPPREKEIDKIRPMELVGLWWHKYETASKDSMEKDDQDNLVSADILLFCPDGAFYLARCKVIIQNKRAVRVSNSDGIAYFKGTWERSYADATVRYRPIDGNIAHPIKKSGSIPWEFAQTEISIDWLRFNGKLFLKFEDLHPEDLEKYFFCPMK